MPLSRRTMLRGLGAALALPWLEAMTPRSLAAFASEPTSPRRLAFVFLPNGVNRAAWFPEQVGPLDSMPSALESLAPLRDRLTVYSNFAHANAYALGDGPGDHARSAACFLTGVHPKKTMGSDISVGMSIDQVIARANAGRTRFDSLELGLEPGMYAGGCDSGYSCAYSANISWRSPHTPVAKEHRPRELFERLFALGPAGEQAKAREARLSLRRSVLDGVRDDATALRDRLGAADRRKLEEYLDSVRAVERQVEAAERGPVAASDLGVEVPDGVPESWSEHARVMSDLLTMAFRLDLTRVATLMLANEGSNRPYPSIGVTRGHHDSSHHDNDEEKLADFAAINRLHAEAVAGFLARLAEERDAEGAALLDSTMVVFAGAIGDGNRHDHRNLPVILAGGGKDDPLTAGHGRHVALEGDVPLCDLFVSLAERSGVALDRFGDSRGRFSVPATGDSSAPPPSP